MAISDYACHPLLIVEQGVVPQLLTCLKNFRQGTNRYMHCSASAFYDEAALGSESNHMSKISHFAAGLENLAH